MLRKAVSVSICIVIVLFFCFYLRGIDYGYLLSVSISFELLIVASFFSIAFRYWGVFVWKNILNKLGSRDLPTFSFLSYVYAKSWMARYVPGTVTWIASKVYIARGAGISKSRLTVSSLLEAGVQVSALASLSLIILAFDPRIESVYVGLKIIALLVSFLPILVLFPSSFNKLTSLGLKTIKKHKDNLEIDTNLSAVSSSYLLYMIGAFLSGASYFVITKSITDIITFADFLYITAAFNLAGALGMVTPFVPSGLGVRDGAQLLLLNVVLPKEIALAITIISRLWTAIIDVMFFLIASTFHKVKSGLYDKKRDRPR